MVGGLWIEPSTRPVWQEKSARHQRDRRLRASPAYSIRDNCWLESGCFFHLSAGFDILDEPLSIFTASSRISRSNIHGWLGLYPWKLMVLSRIHFPGEYSPFLPPLCEDLPQLRSPLKRLQDLGHGIREPPRLLHVPAPPEQEIQLLHLSCQRLNRLGERYGG